MRFGVFYELQLPRPWSEDDEHRLFKEALDQVVLADRLGFDHAWEVEHHFLDEYSHSSAPEVFLAAAAARTERIRLGHGIRQVIPRYNHPARTAETVSSLDLVSDGRVDFGFGEGATRLELGGFGIPAKTKRAVALESVGQIVDMMTMTPYPGYQGESFSMPCRNVIPKPLQKPHPPLWMACTNRDTIKVAASLGVGALAFSFVDPEEARTWVDVYYDIVKSEECVPLGHAVNANIALVAGFSVHEDRAEAVRRGVEGFEFFGYALNALVAQDTVPGHTDLWGEFQALVADRVEQRVREAVAAGNDYSAGIGAPADVARHLRGLAEAGVDQVIFLQQAGRNRHEDICSSLELFAQEVMPEFHAGEEERLAKKEAELRPFVEAAMARRPPVEQMERDAIPVVQASVKKAEVGGGRP